MLTQEKANQIGQRWVDDWNDLSVAEYMRQYSDDVVLVSTIALRLIPECNGTLTDKKILQAYWELVRERFPHFKFVISSISFYENKVVVYYSSFKEGTKAIAILTVNPQGLINRVEVSYV
ncbi:MAG TPA: nuclear transport factor 2 family protein [Chitinophagaceae bacterium]|nr:nuclear transport factor 2 family protein [Chitinophagaceae bacterium]